MSDNEVSERVLMKLSEMAECETVGDLVITYMELKHLLRGYKYALELQLKCGKETTENDT